MAKFSIIDASTGEVKYSGTPRYNGTYCKVSYLEFAEICSDAPIEWNVGDYVVYSRTGLTYKLYDIPQPKKRSYKYEYGGAFVYQNVQFFPDTKLLEIEPFRDLVPSDNEIHFTTQASWSVWTNAENLIGRFNAVMQTAHPGEWEFRLVAATVGSDLYKLLHDTWFDFTISGKNVLQGLTKLYDLCGNIGWVHSVENGKNIITVGIPPVYISGIGTATSLYKYGIGNGLTEIRKSTTNRNELKTRLFAYGSTRNMIPRYYNNLTPAIKDAGSVYIPNLMLPLSEWGTTGGQKDASKAYIDNNVLLYGLRPETVYFDGSNGQKEIYPSLEETTIGELYDVMASGATYRPNLTKHGRGVRLDEVEAVSGIVDDGQRSQGGDKYSTSIAIPFAGIDRAVYRWNELEIFDNVAIPVDGNVTISFSDIVVTGEYADAINNFSARISLIMGGNSYAVEGRCETITGGVRITFDDKTVRCKAGDTLRAFFYISLFESAGTLGTFYLTIPATTLTASFAIGKQNEFVVRIPQIGFDISTRARLGSQGLATISMKDGKCGGRSFVVKSVKYNSTYDSWELTLYRGLDESLDLLFPNTNYLIEAGDHFVLLDIAMPETYIGMAELKLLSAATALLNDISAPKPFFEPIVDAKFMVDNSRTLLEGQYMQIADIDITDGSEYVLIDTLVINEGESNIPTYKVTLREQKKVEYNNSQSSGSGLTSLAGSTDTPTAGGLTPAQKEILTNLDSWFGSIRTKRVLDPITGQYTSPSFYTYGEITAGGIGEDAPVVSTTLGGLLNVTDSADDIQSADKILVRLANASGANSWTLANLSDISGTVTGVMMNGELMPITNKVVNLGTVITSLAGYATENWVSGNYLASSLKGSANGLAELGSDGKVPSAQLPSYVDDVLEFSSKSAFPATGESGKIYVALDTNLTYRWSGTAYVEISPSLALGETSSTAYRGDRGKIAYDHSQISGDATIHHTHSNKAALDLLRYDAQNNLLYIGDENNRINFAAYGEVTAGGVGSGGGGGGGALYTCADVTAYNNSKVGRSTTEGAQVGDLLAYDGTHWHAVVAPATGVTTFNDRSGAVSLTAGDVEAVLSLTNIENAIKSLQSQVDSVAARDGFDELTATSLFADTLVGTNIYGALHGNADSATNADTLDGQHSSYFQPLATAINTGNIASQSVAYAANANYANGAGNADTVDSEHASAFAHIGAHNNLTASGNEFTFASSGFSGAIYLNYRTAGGTNGNITDYIFSNGAGGTLANLSTLITRSSHGETAYNDQTVVSQALQSLQSQIDSVASRDYAELAEGLMALKMWIEDMFEKTPNGIHTKYNFYSSGEITAGA